MNFHALLRGVPFLRKGIFNGTFSVNDDVLNDILYEFTSNDRDSPHVFIGHDIKEEYETNGVITRIYKGKYKDEDALFYDAEIDKTLYNYLKQKKLTKCSGEFRVSNISEILKNKKARKKWFLEGMAMLGRSSPAVSIARISDENIVLHERKESLSFNADALDNAVLLSSKDKFSFSFDFAPIDFIKENKKNIKGGQDMTKEEIEVLFSEKLQLQNVELENLKEALESYKDENKILKEILEEGTKDKESLKSEVSSLKKELKAMNNKLDVKLANINLYNERMTALAMNLTSSEEVMIGNEEELSREISKYAEKHNLSYTDALIKFVEINKHRIKGEV